MKAFYHLGIFLRKARHKTIYTQDNLAKEIGLTRQTISNWERGMCSPPKKVFHKLISLLEIDKYKLTEAMMLDGEMIFRAEVYPKN